MTLRQLLQREIWSERTSRKIVVKFVIPLSRVLGAAALVFGSYFAVDSFWLTPHERRIAREALPQIDVLERNQGISAGDFETQKNLAQAKIDAAQKAAWTDRDRRIASLLSVYMESIEYDRGDAARLKGISTKYPAIAQRIIASDKKHGYASGYGSLIMGRMLHQILD